MSENDRISYSFGMKIPGFEGQYSSINFGCSYSSDVKDGETPTAAADRVREFVMRHVNNEYEKIRETGSND